MPDRLQDTASPEIAEAIEANLFEFIQLFALWSEAELHDGADLLWTLTDIPFALFNSLFRANLDDDQVDAAISAAKDRAGSRKVPILWWTGPTTRPNGLGRILKEHAFTDAGSLPGMAAVIENSTGEEPTVQGLAIEPVTDPQTLDTWCRTAKTGFEMPDVALHGFLGFFGSIGVDGTGSVRHFLGRLNGEPVATASVLLGDRVAGIYNVSTLPEARRKGIGLAVTHRALQEARDEGYRVAVLQSSNQGQGVYAKLGFREHCRIDHFAWSPPTIAAADH